MTTSDSTLILRARSDVLAQRDLALAGYGGIAEALDSDDFDFPPEQTAVLLSDHGEMFDLNLVGGYVWELLDGSRTVDDIADEVAGIFDGSAESIRRDIVNLLDDLQRMSLVEKVS